MPIVKVDVKFSDNIAELKERIAAGMGAMEGMKQSVDRTAASIGGQGLFIQANRLGLAIEQIGGVTKLTSAEMERHSATLDKAIEKYKVMGMTAPPAMVALADSMHPPADAADSLKDKLEAAFKDPLGAVKSFASNVVADVSPAMGSAGVAVGAAAAVVGFATVELMRLGSEAEAIGAKIGRMGTQFNIPVQNVSNLRFAVTAAGGDFDTFGDSMFTFQKRIEDNGDAVGKGLTKIGLSLESVKEMRPDEQFLAISNAVRGAGSEVNKSAVAFEIFGKQGKDILPLLMKPLSDLTEESEKLGATWNDRDVAAARAFRGEVTKLGAETEEAWTVLGRTVAPITNEVTIAWDRMKLALANVIVMVATSGDNFLNLVGISKDWALASETAAAKQDTISKAVADGAPKTINYGEAVRFLNEQYQLQKPAVDQASDAAQAWLKKLGDGILAANKATAADETLTRGLAEQGIVRGTTIESVNEYTAAQKKATEEAAKQKDEHHKLTNELLKVEHSLTEIPAELSKIGRSYDETKLGKLADDVGKVEQNAHILNFGFEGMTEGLRHVGAEVIKTSNELHDFEGYDFTGPMLPRVRTLRDAFHNAASDVGQSFGVKVYNSLGDVSTILSNIPGKFAEIGAVAAKTGQAIMSNLASGNVWGAVVAGATGAIQVIKSLFGGVSQAELEGRKVQATFQQSFGSFARMMGAIGSAYAATGRSAAQAQADVLAMMAAEKQGGDAAKAAIDKINEAFDEQKQDAADLDAAIEKYGFSIEQLGPAMQKQNLDGQAKTLINDWRLLVGSGMDVVTVDQKMASSTWDYLQLAKKTGQEVPQAMKPVIQSMLDQGVFTDAAGNKITEMKDLGLTFSESMTAGFDKVVAKLQQLLDTIGMVPSAIAAVPRTFDVTANVHYNDPGFRADGSDPGNYAALGGLVTNHGVQYLAGGGNVLAFTPRGSDTVPAMLTPGEGVVNRTGMASLGAGGLRALNRGDRAGSGPAPVVDMSGVRADLRAMRDEISRQQAAFPQAVARAVRDEVGKVRSGGRR